LTSSTNSMPCFRKHFSSIHNSKKQDGTGTFTWGTTDH